MPVLGGIYVCMWIVCMWIVGIAVKEACYQGGKREMGAGGVGENVRCVEVLHVWTDRRSRSKRDAFAC